MTIGPAPMIRMELMSVRLGIVLILAISSTKRREQVVAVLRAGRGLGVVLHGEDRLVLQAEAFVASRRTATRASPRRPSGSDSGSTQKPWFWLVISTLPVCEVLDRMVGAAMAARHLLRAAAERQRQHLVAEADAEDRHAACSSTSRITGTA